METGSISLIESDESPAPSFTLGLQHSDAIYSSTADECAASSIPADSIAANSITIPIVYMRLLPYLGGLA